MKITNEFTVHTPIERAWALLTDLEGIAPCLPGAQLTGVDGDTYSGRVKVKVGPVVSDFAGTARFITKDDEARRAVIDAKGRDSRSAGNAAAVVTAQLRADGDRTLVNVDTDLKISGKLAQFGSGMIKEVSSKLLGQFVTNLEAKLAAEPADEASDPPTPGGQDAQVTQGAPASKGALSAAGSAGADSAEGVTNAGPAPDPGDSGSTDSGEATGSGEVTDSGEPVSPASLNGTSVRILPGQNAPLPAVAPLSSESGGAEAAAEPGTTTKDDGVASGEAVAVPERFSAGDEPEALDLLALAGGSVYKRVIPLGIGAVVVAAVIVWFVARR